LLTVRRFLDGARGGLYMQPNAIDESFTPYDDAETSEIWRRSADEEGFKQHQAVQADP
jgi:hypothetical protein